MIDLNTERMIGAGDFKVDDFIVNKLYGLDDFCKKYVDNNKTLLELGCNIGVSTELFCNYAKTVTGVDMNKQIQIENLENKFKNFNFIYNTFDRFFSQNSNTYDIIYIDGAHDAHNAFLDIQNSLNIINDNGIICGHDFNKTTGVEEAVLRFFDKNRIEIFSDSSWAVAL